MDRKGIAFLAVCVAGMVGLKYVADWIWPTPPGGYRRPAITNSVASGTNSAVLASAQNSVPAVQLPPSTNAPGFVAVPSISAAEETVDLENDLIRIKFTSHGGGARQIELKKFPASVNCRIKDDPDKGLLASLNRFSPVPALTLGAGPLTGDGLFAVRKTPAGVRAEKPLPGGLYVIQDWALSNGYFLNATVTIENRGTAAAVVPAHEYAIGASTPMDRRDRSGIQGTYWYDGSKVSQLDQAWFANKFLGCLSFDKPRQEYVAGHSNVVWSAVHNQFFALIAIPDVSPAGLRVVDVPLPKPTAAELEADGSLLPEPHAYHTTLTYPPSTLQPGEKQVRTLTVYAGPKEYRLLKDSDKKLDQVMSFSGVPGAAFCAKALLLLLNALHSLIPSYGWSIVILVILIKLAFWPLTAASTRSMKRMATLQPQMNEIREKYKNDPQKMNEKMMAFMREHRINPVGGCLPLILTFPVFIGFFFMLRTAVELRGESFLWCCDLSRPDTLFTVPFIALPLNLMPLLYLGTAYWQSTLTPVSPQMDPMQQKMLKYMPVFFGVLFYNYSAGLTLYWTTQNLMTILQTKITKSNEKTPPATTATVVPVKSVRRK